MATSYNAEVENKILNNGGYIIYSSENLIITS